MHRLFCALAALCLLLPLHVSAETWLFTSPTKNSDGTALSAADKTDLKSCEICIADKDGVCLKTLPVEISKPLGGEEFTVVLSATSAQAASATHGAFRCDNAAGEKGETAFVAATFRPLRPAKPAGPSIR